MKMAQNPIVPMENIAGKIYVLRNEKIMFSSVLHSDQAIDVNVAIIRAFVYLREMLATNKDLARKLERHDKQIANLYDYVERLLSPKTSGGNSIGYI
jgi:hypothetical protein